MTYYSPLRYPGGKGKISTFFSELFTANNLVGGTYIEPYVGGGSIALYLLMNRIVNRIIINDMDRSLFAFWHSVLNNSEEFCQLITNTPVTMETWHLQREIQRNKADVDLLSLGFSTFFLNRTNRSGIIKGGVIGGLNQTGNYLIDARYNPDKLRERIQAIARFSNHIELFNLDAVELVNNLQNDLPNNSLFYFDPPYYVKGKGLYMNYYNDQDHLDIYNAITQIENQKWIVTYDKVDFIRDLYINYRMFEYSLNYSAATVGKGKEYMILSDNCILPPVSPIKLSHNQ
ncbi:DNA adenine methylase [Bacteroides cellulosilyticus]|jgi:DNA adenine methylase|uniref:DNA adenine methylase n=1 Tax=Bacteroides cellulosilyticus TaxID=246787 RepID=UPI003563DAEF